MRDNSDSSICPSSHPTDPHNHWSRCTLDPRRCNRRICSSTFGLWGVQGGYSYSYHDLDKVLPTSSRSALFLLHSWTVQCKLVRVIHAVWLTVAFHLFRDASTVIATKCVDRATGIREIPELLLFRGLQEYVILTSFLHKILMSHRIHQDTQPPHCTPDSPQYRTHLHNGIHTRSNLNLFVAFLGSHLSLWGFFLGSAR